MKMQTGTLLVACFAIGTFTNFGTSVEVSSQIDLDLSNKTEGNETLSDDLINGNLNNCDNSSESVSHRRRFPTRNWRHGNGVRSNGLRKRRIFPSHDFPRQPKIINNIQIVLNGNDSVLEENSCRHGICNVSVFSKANEEGNIVTEVHLSIITNIKPNVKLDEVPVINGLRGINDEQLIFQPIHTPDLTNLHLPQENIPQIQTNNQGYGEPLYQHRRTFHRPPMYWNYHTYGDRDNTGFRGRKTWTRERPVVDDKIEPPLSSTKLDTSDN